MGRKYSIEDMQKLAAARGGMCLSVEYKNPHTKLRWRCANGHEWEAIPLNIMHGTWCPVEGGHMKLDLGRMKAHATSKGGKCISRVYVNARTPLKWHCKAGHEWFADADHVLNRGHWCKVCGGTARKDIEAMRQLAAKRGGECLSSVYRNARTRLLWRCQNGHKWHQVPNVIASGKWCSRCAGNHKLTIEDMRALAASRGGQCLSRVYKGSDRKLTWRCLHGHTWKAVPSSIRQGRWCRTCTQGPAATIRAAKSFARERGGECVSRRIDDSYSKLRWECHEGHRWTATYKSVKDGSWCPQCPDSRGETICREIFEKLFGNTFPKVNARRLRWLISSKGGRLELDGYCSELRIAFEYNGHQHYNPAHVFNQNGDFSRRQKCDAEKARLCMKHGVKLIAVPEFPRLDDLADCERRIRVALEEARIPQSTEEPPIDPSRSRQCGSASGARLHFNVELSSEP